VEAYTRVKAFPAGGNAVKALSRLTFPARRPRFNPSQITPAPVVGFPSFRDCFVPNIASAKKNMRKSRAATVRNRAQRSALRTALKKAQAPDAAAEQKVAATQLLDRAARKGLIHKNNAARNKSRLSA
jgi:small subunit ribosomal protein S20